MSAVPPAELVALQRRYYELDARCEEIGARFPRAVDIAAGEAEVPDELAAELKAARKERLKVVEGMRDHEWWAGAGDYTEAKGRVREAARGGGGGG